ncbi:hypothetical protein AB833_31260 [Chromatiales bacterium (ex Bugula neritina AB1)]|nr:hypothetical protein AB833_31260 [Chromatiales bacterium (ex Bugula neritina AB1)]
MQALLLRRNTPHYADDKFLLIEEAAGTSGISAAQLRQGIARGLIPMRRDNKGAIRIHLDDLPIELPQKLEHAEIDSDLLSAVYEDELLYLRDNLNKSDVQQKQLQQLLERQSQALDRSAAAVESLQSESARLTGTVGELTAQLSKSAKESEQLSDLLQRTFTAIRQREEITARETDQLSGATEKAMELLERALGESEKSAVRPGTVAGSATQEAVARSASDLTGQLKRELEQRNSMIDNQHQLMERLVALSEKSLAQAPPERPRKRSFWQRLWGGGKGL